MKKFVLWIDDEPNLVQGEIFDLKNSGYSTEFIDDAAKALDWLFKNPQAACAASGIIIDLLMPTRGDSRLKNGNLNWPVGVRLCEQLKTLDCWSQIQPKITLYTRSASTSSTAEQYASEFGLKMLRKTISSRIALELIKKGDLN